MEHQEEKKVEVVVQKKPSVSIPAAIITGFAIVALAIVFTGSRDKVQEAPVANTAQETPTKVSKEIATVRPEDHVSGDRNAKIAVITYSDGDCPFCARFHETMKTVLDENKDVSWVYRHLPLEIHPNAFNEAVALECVANLGGEQAFWNYLDATINETMDADDAETPKKLLAFATKEGISEDAFKNCFSAESSGDKVIKEITEIAEAGARGTPFSIAVNQKTGKQVIIPGAAQLDSMKQIIKELQ